jgi:adenylate cyclase
LRPLFAHVRGSKPHHLGRAFWAGISAVLLCVLFQLTDPRGLASSLRERWFDQMLLHWDGLPKTSEVVVVDIDRDSLDRVGPWPWPRGKVADLVERIGAQKPRAVAVDIVFQDRMNESDSEHSESIRLAEALGRTSIVLGMALDPSPTAAIPQAPPVFVSRGDNWLSFGGLVSSEGLAAPGLAFLAKARSTGILSLLHDDGAPVRDAPLFAYSQGKIWTSLGLEAVRIGEGEVALNLDAASANLRVGRYRMAYPAEGKMRLSFASDTRQVQRTFSAVDVLAQKTPGASFEGKIVLIGSSAPEAGGLRPTARNPFTPSVQIHADVATQIISNFQPLRPGLALPFEAAVALLSGCLSVVIAVLAPPGLAFAFCFAIATILLASAMVIASLGALLVDPVWPVAAVGSACIIASFVRLSTEWVLRMAIERRFSMHLAPEIVARIVADPGALKMSGERRELTALFTDIEGFTAMTEHADPEDLVTLLDQYVELVCAAVRAHKGMTDKVVGDAVHAFFNAPIDLPEHADQAIACAREIEILTAKFRNEPLAQRLGLGRTRIGIETGPVIVGDIGGPNKLDYTAHGPAVNLAARLEAFNKSQRTSIAIGPGAHAAARMPWPFVQIGTLRASSVSPEIPVYTLGSPPIA